MDPVVLLHHTVCGGLAAAGFGVLFNFGWRSLPWCAASGALALAVRTLALAQGLSLEGSSFLAAVTVGAAVQLLHSRIGVSRNTLDAVGCIPMIPGGFAAKGILGLFAVTLQHPAGTDQAFLEALESALRVTFTIGALGTGLAMPILVVRARGRRP